MKATLYDGSRSVTIDTRQDTCLVSAPHPSPGSPDAMIYHKDLYLHEGRAGRSHYYFHIRPSGTDRKGKVIPVSPVMAERHLLQLGLTCADFPASEPIFRLYNHGYGIAEEF